jgi:50S ribosomal protein L16 3-hydroxylase
VKRVPEFPIEVQADARHRLGMSAAHFLRDYWQKRPLLIRGAFAGLQSPLAPEDLAGLACEETALSRIVTHDRRRDAWQVRNGPFAEEEFPSLPKHDWTLLVQDVDKWDPDVAALLPHFDFLPRWRIDDVMVSFAAPGGSVGAHVDQYDVFLLQGMGIRRWQIDARANAPKAFRDDVELKLLQAFSPSHDWRLQPGDMLYLPPGVPHHGVAEDACLTFSIGMRAPARSELVGDFADHLCEAMSEDDRYADADLAPAEDRSEIDGAALRRVAAALGPFATPDPATLALWFGRFITRYRSAGEIAAPPRPPSATRLAERVAAGATVHRHPLARVAWTRHGRAALLFVDGEHHACSVPFARRLCEDLPLGASDYAAWDPAQRELLHDLVRRGRFALSRRS